ncbi:hypothetical protein PF007_g6439 [Phytophthora fragariae]|uniref:Uncharacterized protein n=1 Tax=Phytophthora fragariae TaxID=53985 RepID=A0A6A3SW01_9STRA|nr:hypothetical protein PF009_g6492 [Phytophthora fragariae]KAE9125216.1 hypothetical protein PF007_g6439 [Phytophthora fragariae]KAE9150328.1 hypothetical protein PF006_g5288 [Phytophthora fragariae]KAE9246147.1 hypothetical protein PF004_g4938 [Phytophthora fragariae]KAE9321170.1 hypothetical protein PF001_g5051 [Phytophthora fragariae]
MDFFNKAKQAAEKYAGGDSSSSSNNKKSDSMFSKAKDAAEDEKHQPGYVEKKDKSTVDKVVEVAEDFLAKQGQPKSQSHSGDKKDNQMEDILGKAKEAVDVDYSYGYR